MGHLPLLGGHFGSFLGHFTGWNFFTWYLVTFDDWKLDLVLIGGNCCQNLGNCCQNFNLDFLGFSGWLDFDWLGLDKNLGTTPQNFDQLLH